MHIHLIGVAGTGMGALAGLLKAAGHRVSGSDTAFYPPMGDALARWGVETRQGFRAEHVADGPDLVVIGNVCRKDNPEARAAIDGGLRYTSFPGLMEELFLTQRPGFVVAGTHGKTTTTALVSWLLTATGKRPGFLVGGIPKNFGESFALGAEGAPFVIEGDEYDSAFFEKTPKFWRYRPWAAVLTSVEQDHIDIYPTMDAYRAAFRGFVERIPDEGILAGFAGDAEVRALLDGARSRVRTYALDGDAFGAAAPHWLAAPVVPRPAARVRPSPARTTSAIFSARWPSRRRETAWTCTRSSMPSPRSRVCAGGRTSSPSPAAFTSTTTSRTTRPPCARPWTRSA